MHLPEPKFPPLLTGHAVKGARPLDVACRGAAEKTLGAGDLVWSRNTQRVECALVLEPEVSREISCQMAIVGAVAVMETLGALAPPQVAVELRWPGAVLLNGGRVGSVTLAAPRCAANAVPDWLALAVTLALRADNGREPGETRDATTLGEEGLADATRTDVLESLAPRLLAWVHTWSEDGFRPIHDQWLFRAFGRDQEITIGGVSGRVVGLDEAAGVMLRGGDGRISALPYLPHLETVS
jgi:biotin-(acetyl-CoA carboxylase) ligase